METTDIFRKAETTLREANKEVEFSLLALRGALAEAEAEHLGAKKSIDWENAKSVLAAKHAFERYSAVSLAVQDVSGVVSAATAGLRSLDLHGAEWEVYACRNDLAP
ncbi:hypothetical protein C8J31_11680 [Rhizobium sp. PP-CC-2G-626]|nr:hypothetical protein C8J31_11680 [Rhizobium sp. PP-CC-2G-626]